MLFFALVGLFLQLLELFGLFHARLAISFGTLLSIIRLEGHARSFHAIDVKIRKYEIPLRASCLHPGSTAL
jgi:hypothetical protein